MTILDYKKSLPYYTNKSIPPSVLQNSSAYHTFLQNTALVLNWKDHVFSENAVMTARLDKSFWDAHQYIWN